jgi:hypothetical protein
LVHRIKTQIAKKGHSMTNRIEVTKDQALEVSRGSCLPQLPWPWLAQIVVICILS